MLIEKCTGNTKMKWSLRVIASVEGQKNNRFEKGKWIWKRVTFFLLSFWLCHVLQTYEAASKVRKWRRMLEDRSLHKRNIVQNIMRQLVNNPRWWSVIIRYADIFCFLRTDLSHPTCLFFQQLFIYFCMYVWKINLK